jgi:glycosyltransferase involved in cell wall biosynthesis
MNAYPLIFYCYSVLHQAQYLEKTILSVLSQNYPNLAYIIVDGGSTDKSLEIIKKYEKFLKYWVTESDQGQNNALNKGFKYATGGLLTWLNSDDYYMPGALHKVAGAAVAKPQAHVFVGAGQIVDRIGKVLHYKEPHPR